MEIKVCKTCGGVGLERKGNYYVCNHCGNKWIIDVADDVTAVERVNAWTALRDGDFEKAAELFENIIIKDSLNHEGYWGRALALNAILYVDDSREGKKVPTCNNITENSFLNDKDVQKAISLAPEEIKSNYQLQAEQIEKIRIEWINIASKEPPYDVFISFKDSDREHDVNRTQDSIDAQEIYTGLVDAGYKVFYSRVSLRGKVSEQYEPYIYNAIKTAKVMIVFGEKPEYFISPWIKNEWSRFKTRVDNGEKHKNSLVVVVKDMNPSDLPVALRTRQAMNMGDLTFFETLKKHIKRVIDESDTAVRLDRIEIKGGQMAKKSTKIKTETLKTRELGGGAIAKTSISEKQTLDLAHSYILGKQWEDANKLLDDILFNNPNLADAIWYKLQSKFQVVSGEELFNKISLFTQEDYNSITQILSYAEKELATNVLNSLYAKCKSANESDNILILNTILPFNYENRDEKIKVVFTQSIISQRYQVFKLLLSALDSKDVDSYIKYNFEYAKNTKNIEIKEICLNNIVSVDEGNEEAQKMLLKIYLDKDEIKKVTRTLETILKYSSDTKQAVIDLLCEIKKALNSNEDCLALREVLKYYSGELVELKDLLIDSAFVMISQGFFDHAKYFLSLVLSADENNAKIYWGLCLVKTKSRTDNDIIKSDIALKQIPEYTKYLTMVDESRRQECFKLAKKQEGAQNSRKKAKKVKIISAITSAVVAVIVAVVMVISFVLVPNNKFTNATNLINAGKYDEAMAIYKDLDGYKNSDNKINVINALKLVDNGELENGIRQLLDNNSTVTITYDTNGGKLPSDKSISSNNANIMSTNGLVIAYADEPENVFTYRGIISYNGLKNSSKNGYEFVKWELVECKPQITNDKNVIDIALKAVWQAKDYTVTYNLNGGVVEGENILGYNPDEDSFTLINPTRRGYTFIGWTGTDLTEKTMSVTVPKGSYGNREYTANWSANTYTVTYDANGGTASKTSDTATYDKAFNLATAERRGYTFLGWFVGETKYDNFSNWELENGLELTAEWEIITYTIDYTLNGGSVTNVGTYTVEDNVQIINPTRTGYTFTGWTGSGLNQETKDIILAKGTTGNKEYIANWTANTYTVTFNANGGTASKLSDTATYDSNFTLATAERKGYEFVGWKADGKTYATGDWKTDKNVDLVADWKVIDYTIIYNLDGGSVTGANSATYTIEDTITLKNPTKTGYTFTGWTGTDLSGKTMTVTISKGTIDDKEYTANWTANTYTLSFNANGGNAVSSKTVTYDSTYTVPTPARDGYTFVAWKYNNVSYMGGQWKNDFDTTLVAEWATYTVSTEANNTNAGSYTIKNKEKVTAGNTVTLTAQTNTGYEWKGWYSDGILKSANLRYTFTMPKSNVNLVAIWELVAYNISYTLNDGLVSGNPETYTVEDSITLKNPTKTGYTFAGWTGTDLSAKTMTVTIAKGTTKEKSYVANWTAKNYTITFNAMGGILLENSKTVTYNEEYNTPIPKKEGYQFVSWKTSGGDEYDSGIWKTDKNVTLVATWIADTHVFAYSGELITGLKSEAKKLKHLYIPNKIGTNAITGIDDHAFNQKSIYETETFYMETVEISDGITSIGIWAFNRQTHLYSVTLGKDVSSIHDTSFDDCDSLELFNVNEENQYYRVIDGNLYNKSGTTILKYVNRETTSFTIPNSVTSISDYVFDGCANLKEIIIPTSVSWIGDYAFSGTGLVNVILPNSVKHIGNYAFSGCRYLRSIYIPQSVTSTNYYLFSSDSIVFCEAESQPSGWGENWNYYGNTVIWGCKAFGVTDDGLSWVETSQKTMITGYDDSKQIVTIPETINGKDVGEIMKNAFYGCENLTTVIIPSTITQIDSNAFVNCKNLDCVVLPESLLMVNYAAFSACDKLNTIYYQGSEDVWSFIEINTNSGIKNATVYYYMPIEPALNSEGTAYDGNYWRYVDGAPTVWIYEG